MFETWQHATPDESLTLLQLKDPPEIKTLNHATTSSTASQLKDDDYNSCVEWAVAAASADDDGEYDSDIEGDFEHLDSDRFMKPAAKSNKGIGGVLSNTTVAFKILKRFMARHQKLSSLKPVRVPLIAPPKEDEDVYKDDKLFQDDTTEVNLEEDKAFYCVNTTGRRGCSLSTDGPPRPDTSGMTTAKAQEVINKWRVLRKVRTDKMQREHRTLFGSNPSTKKKYSRVLYDRLWLMSDVEVTTLFKGHTFPTKEILLIRFAEEANFCGCQIAIVRSDNYQLHV